MARLFGNYDKPGPGIGKEEGRSFGILKYFEIFFRKFWSLAFANIVYLIVFLPVVFACFGLVMLVNHLGYGGNGIITVLCFAPTILLAPANAGLAKITRDFGREEPCFVWQDFWESAKTNLKQSFAVSSIGYVGSAIFIMAMTFYRGVMTDSFFSIIPFSISIVLCVLFITLVFYMQLMVVTLDLKISLIFKNAAILTIVVLGKNLIAMFVAALFAALYAILFYISLGNQGALILLVAITFMVVFSLIAYTVNYVMFHVIHQYIIEPFYRANPQKTADGIIHSTDENDEEDVQKELPEYVYENGRMVHRSVIETRSLFDDQGKEDGK